MREKKYVCLRCAKDFNVKVMDQNEAQTLNVRLVAVTCPICHTEDIQSAEEFECHQARGSR